MPRGCLMDKKLEVSSISVKLTIWREIYRTAKGSLKKGSKSFLVDFWFIFCVCFFHFLAFLVVVGNRENHHLQVGWRVHCWVSNQSCRHSVMSSWEFGNNQEMGGMGSGFEMLTTWKYDMDPIKMICLEGTFPKWGEVLCFTHAPH